MQAKIGSSVLAQLRPAAKPYEVHDATLPGFGLRVQPSGVMTYFCSYRAKNTGRRNRIVLGRHPVLTPSQARDRAKSILGRVADGKDPAHDQQQKRQLAAQHTLRTFITQEYEPWAKQHLTDSKGAIARLKCFEDLYPKRLADLSPWVLEKWRTAKMKAGASPATVNRDIAALRSVLSRAVEWRLVESHPLQGMKRVKVKDEAVTRYLSETEEADLRAALERREMRIRQSRASANAWRAARGYPLLPSLPPERFADHLSPMVLISLNTGLRQGEMFKLQWADVSLDLQQIAVRAHKAKSGKVRRVSLNAEAYETLLRWRGSAERPADALVFPGKEGRPLDNVQSAWEAVLKDAKIVKFRWHDLRHHFASKLAMAGVSLNDIRELLGHSDFTTSLRYAHLSQQHLAEAVAKICRITRTSPSSHEPEERVANSAVRVGVG